MSLYADGRISGFDSHRAEWTDTFRSEHMAKKKQSAQDTLNNVLSDMDPPKKHRPDLSPYQWEKMAKWIEARALQAELRAVQAEDLLRQGIGGDALRAQIGYWRATVAVSRKLAYDCRIGNNGPLNLNTINERIS